MKIEIPVNLKGKELFSFLYENKTALINQKKSMVKHAGAFNIVSKIIALSKSEAKKAGIQPVTEIEDGTVRVKVVANTANWMDDQYDVLLPDSAKKSIKERKSLIPHIHDHIHQVDAVIGDVQDIYLEDFMLSDLGIDKMGATQCIVFETDVKQSYNEAVYNMYKAGKINQHSIGLLYVKIDLAVNDPESPEYFAIYNKYIGQIINRDDVEQYGFFWAVSEIKLMENSCVLFGCNEITPTLSVDTTKESKPSKTGTSGNEPEEKTFDFASAMSRVKI